MRVRNVFWNVLKHAVKFIPTKGKITVQTSIVGDRGSFLVKISDTGIGMTHEELARVFTAFSQGDHAKDFHRFGGLGLGLAISQKIVGLRFGPIYANSEGRNKGANFTFELPLSIVKDDKKLSKKNPPANLLSSQKNMGKSILLVEDHEPTRSALANLLTPASQNPSRWFDCRGAQNCR